MFPSFTGKYLNYLPGTVPYITLHLINTRNKIKTHHELQFPDLHSPPRPPLTRVDIHIEKYSFFEYSSLEYRHFSSLRKA